jgi:hypothetical protein
MQKISAEALQILKKRKGDCFVITKCQFCFNKKPYIYKNIKN